jgi:membrane protein DedA with SNARE-associated domain
MADDEMTVWAWVFALLTFLAGFLPFVFDWLCKKAGMLAHFVVASALFGFFVWRYVKLKKSKDKKV